MTSIAGLSARQGTFAIGIQSVKGTAAAAPTWKGYFQAAPTIQPVRAESNYTMTDASRFMQGDPYITGVSVAGTVPLYAHPDLMALLAHLTLGADADQVGKVQVITLSGYTGTDTFKLTYNGVEGSTVFTRGTNCTAAAIQTALRTATSDSSLTVAGTTDTGPFTVTFVATPATVVTVTSPSGGSSGVTTASSTHTATCANTLPYFTAWRTMAGGIVEQFTDCQINSLQLQGNAGQAMVVTLDIIGITSTFLNADTTVDPTTTRPYTFMDGQGALEVDTVAYPMHEFDITIANNLVGFQADGFAFDAIDPQGLDISGSYTIRYAGSTAAPIDYRKFYYSDSLTDAGSDSGTVQTISVGTHALQLTWTQVATGDSFQIAIPVSRWAALPVQPDPGGSVVEVQVAYDVMRAGITAHVENTPITVTTVDQALTA